MADYEARCRGEIQRPTAGNISDAVTGGEGGGGAEEKGDDVALKQLAGTVENGAHRKEGGVEEDENKDSGGGKEGEGVDGVGSVKAGLQRCCLMDPPTVSPRTRSYRKSPDALNEPPRKHSLDTLMVLRYTHTYMHTYLHL